MRIAVPDLISNSYFPAVAAVELGFFKAEGLDVELELVFPVPKTMEDLRDGKLDFVAGAAHATLQAFPNWKGAKLLAALAQNTYWMLVLKADLNAKMGDVDAVKGLRIGAAPGPDSTIRQLLVEARIDLERDNVNVGPVPGSTGAGVSFGVNAAKALEDGVIDGFWANAMGVEVAVRKGTGTVVLDARRGICPPAAVHYTFPALVTSDAVIERDPESVRAAVRAIVNVQKALKEDPSRATEVGEKLFPAMEAALIAGLIERDLPFYDPSISEDKVKGMNGFAMEIGLLTEDVAYDQVVGTQFSGIWTE
ncbi:MAG: ABC transporter substrate-binding protein [SAR202 cluster bacterium]|jgi:ABC-type nitrate/sulfonate/bicarbonate transport system substrate-binding protein|nr:ABC transporter substrate-binding protein [Dehalococcoidia bacterium]MQG54817.1 ABC transporter substrate-binding protein [SAR202 cluster bacterium]|tara:strand:+ start:7079 stop:8002 length:924 start_codon:yes stop_codon:yes gene_type:complete